MAEKKIEIEISAEDKSSNVFRRVGRNLDNQTKNWEANNKRMIASSKKMAAGVIAAGAALTAGLGIAGRDAIQFEKTMANVSTLISGDSTDAIDTMTRGIIEMSKALPVTPQELGASAYDILSAGITDSAMQMQVLKDSAELAVAGLASTQEGTKIMTGALNAFGLEASDSNKVSDILFKTVKNGINTISDVTQSFGATSSTIAAAGISIEEFSAATAALTTTTKPAPVAQNSLRASVLALQAPTGDMAKLFKKAGIASGEKALKEKGLVEVMRMVSEAAGGQADKLKKAYGSSEALGASLALTGEQAEAFESTLKDMTQGVNAVDEAFQKQTETLSAQWRMLMNDINSKVMPSMIRIVGFLADNLIPTIERVSNFVSENRNAFVAASIGITTMLIPAFISWSIAAGAAAIATIAATWPLIALGVAVAALAYLWINKWNEIRGGAEYAVELIKGFVENMGKSILLTFQLVAGYIKWQIGIYINMSRAIWGAMKNIASGVKSTWNSIKSSTESTVSSMVDSVISRFKSVIGRAKSVFNSMKNAILSVLRNIKLPTVNIDIKTKKVAGIKVKYPKLSWYQQGGFVPKDMPAYLHAGEFVMSNGMVSGRRQLPPSVNNNNNQNVTLNAVINNEMDIYEVGETLAWKLNNSAV